MANTTRLPILGQGLIFWRQSMDEFDDQDYEQKLEVLEREIEEFLELKVKELLSRSCSRQNAEREIRSIMPRWVTKPGM